eukprot:CAMPEP_0206521222 /NCGR_PEP_ID=MMETSP0324_2-20121206/66206_1 /ASSEMBLY_ACC=CAM_ASM_000836 /TAXON_ID=2866 /ORGANISM="Crypthecodinium cohnii, Strain Seligo" /LENGTH=43 /DNA_ID= /DNA_START= /DNA_END= /DNA_ORIENTATION=
MPTSTMEATAGPSGAEACDGRRESQGAHAHTRSLFRGQTKSLI